MTCRTDVCLDDGSVVRVRSSVASAPEQQIGQAGSSVVTIEPQC